MDGVVCFEIKIVISLNYLIINYSDRTNMATTLNTSELLRIIPQPTRFSKGTDVEEFLSELQIYFNTIQINEEQRNVLVRAFMDDDTRKIFEKEPETGNYEERFRKAFQKTTNLAEDLQNALSYRKGSTPVDEYIRQIEKNVEKIMKHKMTTTKLTAFFLKYCLDDDKMREEVSRFEYTEALLKLKTGKEMTETEDQKGPAATKYIKEIIRTVELKTKHDEIMMMTKPSYASVVRRADPNTRQQPMRRNEYRGMDRAPQHMNREATRFQTYQNQRSNYGPKCYACQEVGHIRRQCPNIRCSACKRNGHLSQQCYMGNKDRFTEREMPRRTENRRDGYYGQGRINRDRLAAMNYGEDEQSDSGERKQDGTAERRYGSREDTTQGNDLASNIGEMLGAIQTQ
jgi:hypothetical protein